VIKKRAVAPLNSQFKFRVKVDKIGAFTGKILNIIWSEDIKEFDVLLGLGKSPLKIKKKKSTAGASGKKKFHKSVTSLTGSGYNDDLLDVDSFHKSNTSLPSATSLNSSMNQGETTQTQEEKKT